MLAEQIVVSSDLVGLLVIILLVLLIAYVIKRLL